MTTAKKKLKPDETVQKILISTTSRMVGEYENSSMVITHAWPSLYDSSASLRMSENPLSRSGFIVAFETPPMDKQSGVVVPDYSQRGEMICAYLSVLFGKRFDCHGLVEGTGHYHIPDFTAYSRICNPRFPFNSHTARSCFPIPLEIGQFSSVEKVLDTEIDDMLRSKLGAACKFYMLALQNAEHSPEVAYLHLITAGEILSSFFEYAKEEILDQNTIDDLDVIKNNIEDGNKIANRISERLSSVKRIFVRSLSSLLDDQFFLTAETERNFGHFEPEEIKKRLGAAYDLRSKYVHTGEPFGRWIEPSRGNDDIQLREPGVDDREFAKILARAPKFAGLERLIRYCILKFMVSRELLIIDQGNSDDTNIT